MKIGVVGSGYVGLVTGTCLAEKGNEVTCVDNDPNKVASLQAGKVPIFEPGLEELVRKNTLNGNLKFTTELQEGLDEASVVFLSLPTPEAEDGSADLQHVLGVAKDIGHLLISYTVIVTKSTVPPGTSDMVREAIGEFADPKLFDVTSNPEFLKEGDAIRDFQHPDRIVVGVDSDQAWKTLRELYLPFVPNRHEKLMRVGIEDAELIKYAANTFLAARVALTNEIANIAELVGADARTVMQAVGLDARIGESFLNPGPGYGGSCFPKDVQALERTAARHGYDFKIANAVHESNQRQKRRLPEKVLEHFEHDLKGKTIALWGLSFKPKTDDIRETPAFEVIDGLTAAGAKIVGYDPEAIANMKRHYGEKSGLTFAETHYDALKGVDALVIVTDWDEFKTPNWKRMRELMKSPVIFDGRSLYDIDQMQSRGFHYDSLGRQVVRGWPKK